MSSLLLKRTLPTSLFLAELAPHEPAIAFVTVGELRKWARRARTGRATLGRTGVMGCSRESSLTYLGTLMNMAPTRGSVPFLGNPAELVGQMWGRTHCDSGKRMRAAV